MNTNVSSFSEYESFNSQHIADIYVHVYSNKTSLKIIQKISELKANMEILLMVTAYLSTLK